MTATPLFEGVAVALVTLFDDAGAVDAGATADLAVRLVDVGVRAVVVTGTTGEAAAVSGPERRDLLRAVRATVPAAVPVIAGTGAPSAHQAVAFTRDAVELGVDGVLALSPPGGGDVRPYYEAIAKETAGLPLLAYHFPSVSAPGIPIETLVELPVQGLKDSSGDAKRLAHELDVFEGWIYVGSADLALQAGALGCAGVILAMANLAPEESARAFGGDADAQRELSRAARRVGARPFRGLKEAVADRFETSPVCRMG